MWKLNVVTQIRYLSEYRYRVVFDDGTAGDVDFTEYLSKGPVFMPLRDLNVFRRAHIEGGTIAWPTGADIAPETLYEKCSHAAAADGA